MSVRTPLRVLNGGRRRSRRTWPLRDWWVVAICRTIGCSGPFAERWEWPYMRVCHPLAMRLSGVRGSD